MNHLFNFAAFLLLPQNANSAQTALLITLIKILKAPNAVILLLVTVSQNCTEYITNKDRVTGPMSGSKLFLTSSSLMTSCIVLN